MDPRLQRRIQRYGWDKAAGRYERGWRQQLEPAQRRLLELARPQPGESVLDVACGTGLVTFPAAAAVGAHGRVVAVDLSSAMVEEVRRRARESGVDRIEALQMGAEALDLPARSFDLILCALGLMYLPDVASALHEQWRVLRPGGRIAAAVWGERRRCGWAEIFPIVDRRVRSEVCPMFFQLGSGDVLRSVLELAGFCDVHVERTTTELVYSTAEEALEAAFEGGPVALAYSRFEPEVRDEVHVEYLDSIERFWDGGQYRVPGEFVLAVARRSA